MDGMDVCAQLDVGALLSEPSIDFGLLNLFDPPTPLNPFPRLAAIIVQRRNMMMKDRIPPE